MNEVETSLYFLMTQFKEKLDREHVSNVQLRDINSEKQGKIHELQELKIRHAELALVNEGLKKQVKELFELMPPADQITHGKLKFACPLPHDSIKD